MYNYLTIIYQCTCLFYLVIQHCNVKRKVERNSSLDTSAQVFTKIDKIIAKNALFHSFIMDPIQPYIMTQLFN